MKKIIFINQKNSIICDNLYIHNLLLCLSLNAEILNIPGIKFVKHGIIEESPKLNKESLINEFVYFYIYNKSMKYNTKKLIII